MSIPEKEIQVAVSDTVKAIDMDAAGKIADAFFQSAHNCANASLIAAAAFVLRRIIDAADGNPLTLAVIFELFNQSRFTPGEQECVH